MTTEHHLRTELLALKHDAKAEEDHLHTKGSALKHNAKVVEDHLHTEAPALKRDAKVEEASCFCPGTQFAVHYGGKCECIDDSFGSVKRDALPETEEASRLCPGTQIAVHYRGYCQCINDNFGGVKRDANPKTEEASCLCPGTQIAVHYGGKCECIDDGFGKRDVQDHAITGNPISEKRTLTPFVKCPADCPASTRPVYNEIGGEVRCTCRPLGQKSSVGPDWCNNCEAGTDPFYWNDGKYCFCNPSRGSVTGMLWVPYAKCLDDCSPLAFKVAFADENGKESCPPCGTRPPSSSKGIA